MRHFKLLPLLAAALAISTANAATTFTVQATVSPVCKINSAGNMTFAQYDPNGSMPQTTSTIVLQCTKKTPYNVGLTSANTWNLKNTASGELLPYHLYQPKLDGTGDTSTIWADGARYGGTAADRNPFSLTVTGQIPVGTDVPLGTYQDTVTVDVVF